MAGLVLGNRQAGWHIQMVSILDVGEMTAMSLDMTVPQVQRGFPDLKLEKLLLALWYLETERDCL